MSKAHFIFKPLTNEYSVNVDGHDIKDVTQSVAIKIENEKFPVIEIFLSVVDCEVDVEGKVLLNGSSIPDGLARGIYGMLKKRFEKDRREDESRGG